MSSSVSPGTLPESEVFSDDSGVDVKPRNAATAADSRRNRRKSSEPKKRKEVLLMRRFRWDTDEEDTGTHGTEEVFERPSSGDSGCHLEEEEEPVEKKQKRRKEVVVEEEEEERESVIRECCPGGSSVQDCPQDEPPRNSRRNYKSMSRQRRIEANARERTRVHTISAAFESLRRAVPAYAHNQKLSKLAILRIASAYIVALACLNNNEEGVEQAATMSECVEQCTRTIQAEGRSRRRTYKVSVTPF